MKKAINVKNGSTAILLKSAATSIDDAITACIFGLRNEGGDWAKIPPSEFDSGHENDRATPKLGSITAEIAAEEATVDDTLRCSKISDDGQPDGAAGGKKAQILSPGEWASMTQSQRFRWRKYKRK